MKRLTIAIVISLMAVCLLGTSVLAAEPPPPGDSIVVDIVVQGDDPTVTVEADGDGATIYINGQDLAEPTVKVKKYRIENPYNDTELKAAVSDLIGLLESTDLSVTLVSDGLAKVILVIGEHTLNLQEVLGLVTQNEGASVTRDNDLVALGESQEELILLLGNRLDALQLSFNTLEGEYLDTVADTDVEIEELRSDYTTKLIVTWGVLGAAILLLLFWMVWRIRLGRV